MFRSSIELVFMEKWPLMDGFLHLEDQWPGWIDGGKYRSVFVFLLVNVMNGEGLKGIG